MTRTLCILGLILAVLSCPSRGEWVALSRGSALPVAPVVSLLDDDQLHTTLKVELSGFDMDEFVAGGKTYHSIDLLTDIATNEAGSPEVPYVATMLAAPDQGDVTVEVIAHGEILKFTDVLLPPSRPSWQEGEPEPAYVENNAAYTSGAAYPSSYVAVDEPVVFRDFRVARVAIYPVRYVPKSKQLEVSSSMTIRVTYGGGEGTNPRTAPRRAIPPSFGSIYRHTLLNYERVLNRLYGGMELGREVMLCILPDTFATTFKTYAEWKHKTGTFVIVTKFSQIGANSTNPDIIKNYIAQCYHNWAFPPTYILLGGDYGYVPRKYAEGQSFSNEDYFVEIDGNDVFPEMYIGRLTHQTNTVLQTIINKLIKYERQPYRENQTWFKRAVVCANNAYPTQPETKRWVSAVMRESGGFIVDTLLNSYGSSCIYNLPQVIGAINSGRSILNYRGEGNYAGWWASCYPFNTSNVSSLNNGEMLTFVTSIGCGVAMFDYSGGNCFGEQWLELGTPTSARGACAFVGPTWSNTHTKYNNAIDKGLYVALFQEGLETPAQTLLRGKIRMYTLYGGTDPQVPLHFRAYTVLGDPSTHIWKDVPRAVQLTYVPQIAVGYNQAEIRVLDSATHAPVSGAEVCLAGKTVYVTGRTDASGLAVIPVTPTAIDTLSLLVRGVNVVPAEGTIYVVQEQEHVAPLGDPQIADLDGNLDGKVNPNEHIQISYVLKNWGTQPSVNVEARLSVVDTMYGQIVNGGPVAYGTLGPNESGTGSGTPLQFFVNPTTPVGTTFHVRLHVSSATRSWSYTTRTDVVGCSLQYGATIVNDQNSSNPNGRLDPGETAVIYVRIRNEGQDAAPNVTGILRTSDPYLTILDSTGSFGTLAIGDSALNTADYFVVAASDSTPLASIHSLAISLRTQNGNYPYAVVRDFSIAVGLPSATDPTGPDAYGYYAYSSDDSLYVAAPRFDWVEIRSTGTRVPYVSPGDFTVNPTLPFTFKYYGRNYTRVRISSDGWIAFGTGTQTAFNNYPLPNRDGVTNMVAAFWDDLFESTNNPTSKLFYYNDAVNRRFIVEWDSVAHYSGTQFRESFQIILYDPAFYPTPTGDGEILVQYRIVGEEGSCTIGIEDSTQTIGLQYLYNSTYDQTASEIRDGVAIKFTTKPPDRLVSVGERTSSGALPQEFSLEPNYPNPFNPATTITYALPMGGHVSLKLYDIVGREVCTLVDEEQQAGVKSVRWDSKTRYGTQAASGVYFVRLDVHAAKGKVFSKVRKIMLLK